MNKFIYKIFKISFINMLIITLSAEILAGGPKDISDQTIILGQSSYNSDISDLKKILHGKYEISQTICGQGSFSLVYQATDNKGNKYVIKIPKRKEKLDKWINEKKHTNQLILEIFKDYKGKIKIPFIKEFGPDFIIEEDMGRDTLLTCYKDLSDEDKKYISKEIALLFIYLFDKSDSDQIKEYESAYDNEIRSNIFSIVLIDYINNPLTDKFKKRDISDELLTFVLPDLHLDNIIYDFKTKEIKIIDLDGFKKDCIYKNFLSKALVLNQQDGLSELINNVISYINEYRPNTINKDKLNLFFKMEDMALEYSCWE